MNPRERFELLLSVERNEVAIEEAAARLGTTVDRLQERLELVSLTREALVQHAAPVRNPFRARWVVAAVMVVAGLAFAQLTTFAADTPAMANEVNGNFTQLRTWIEQKVGTVGSASVAVTGPATFQGSATFSGGLNANTISTSSVSATGVSAGSVAISGDLGALSNSWGSGPTAATSFNRNDCNVPSNGATCPGGQYVCGLRASHSCGQSWYDVLWTLQCCSL